MEVPLDLRQRQGEDRSAERRDQHAGHDDSEGEDGTSARGAEALRRWRYRCNFDLGRGGKSHDGPGQRPGTEIRPAADAEVINHQVGFGADGARYVLKNCPAFGTR